MPKIVVRKAAPSPKNTAIAARENVPTAQPATYRLLQVTRRLWDNWQCTSPERAGRKASKKTM